MYLETTEPQGTTRHDSARECVSHYRGEREMEDTEREGDWGWVWQCVFLHVRGACACVCSCVYACPSLPGREREGDCAQNVAVRKSAYPHACVEARAHVRINRFASLQPCVCVHACATPPSSTPCLRSLLFFNPNIRTLEKMSTRFPLHSPCFLPGLFRRRWAVGRWACCSLACRFCRIKPLAIAAAMAQPIQKQPCLRPRLQSLQLCPPEGTERRRNQTQTSSLRFTGYNGPILQPQRGKVQEK